ncbi:peptidase [Spirochaetia bacterium]|nr:peptidase [Spirochaetia bacterium]
MINFYKEALSLLDEASAIRRTLHENPESSFSEYKTSSFIREKLSRLGIPYFSAGETGTVAIIKGREGRTILGLRADIDALEITEQTDLSYKSKQHGLMHACGHDAHTAGLLAAAKILHAHKESFAGTIKLIFQQAEETGLGAIELIKSGLVDDVQAFFGIHNHPSLPVGKIALKSGQVMAGSNSLEITLKGEGSHGGFPHLSRDPIAAGASLVEALQHIVSREIAPTESAVVSVGQFHAGTRDNIIPGEAKISGTVRVMNEETRAQISEAVYRITDCIANAHRLKAEVVCEFCTPVLSNAKELYPLAAAAAEQAVADSVIDFTPQMGTEDFGHYSALAPVFFAFVGSGGMYSLHHECFNIDEQFIAIAAALHCAFAFQFFKE